MRQYKGQGKENTSSQTNENMLRMMVEEGSGWLGVIRNMENDFFRRAFASLMRNPNADTEEAIQCEKFLLMLQHRNPFVQYSAMCYCNEIYGTVWECLQNEYHYSRNDFAYDMINKGLAPFCRDEELRDYWKR